MLAPQTTTATCSAHLGGHVRPAGQRGKGGLLLARFARLGRVAVVAVHDHDVRAGGGDYLAYLLPGMFAPSMMFGVEATIAAMTEDAKKGITDRFRSLPMSGVAVPVGRAGADLANSAVQLAVLMGGGLLIGWSAADGLAPALFAVGLLLWLRFAVLWLGIFLGLTFRATGSLMAVQVLVWPIGFLSGVIVPPETMPAWLATLADWNPISATAAACRELLGNPTGITGGVLADHAVLLAVAWPLALTLAFVPLSALAYRRLGN